MWDNSWSCWQQYRLQKRGKDLKHGYSNKKLFNNVEYKRKLYLWSGVARNTKKYRKTFIVDQKPKHGLLLLTGGKSTGKWVLKSRDIWKGPSGVSMGTYFLNCNRSLRFRVWKIWLENATSHVVALWAADRKEIPSSTRWLAPLLCMAAPLREATLLLNFIVGLKTENFRQ